MNEKEKVDCLFLVNAKIKMVKLLKTKDVDVIQDNKKQWRNPKYKTLTDIQNVKFIQDSEQELKDISIVGVWQLGSLNVATGNNERYAFYENGE